MTVTPHQDQLLTKVAGGDVSAFERLYDLYSPNAFALLLRMLADPDDAREVLQETFLQIWNRAAMFDASRGSEIAWVLSIARSRGIDRLRSRKTRSNRENEAGREISIRTSDVEKPGSLDNAILSQERKAVRAALQELPEAQRKALELAYFDGLSQSEIAERLAQPLGTIKTRMQLGMKKLRDRLRTTLER